MPSPSPRAGRENSNLIGQARQVAREAVQDFQKRLPPELAARLERSLEASQRRLQASVLKLQDRLNRTASQSDLDLLSRRIDVLTEKLERYR